MSSKNKIFIHGVFWLIMIVSTLTEIIPSIGDYSAGIIAGDYFIYLSSHLLVFYIFYFFTGYKNKYFKNKILLFTSGALIVILLTLVFTYLNAIFITAGVSELKGNDYILAFGKIYFSLLQPVILYAVAGSLLKFVVLWVRDEISKRESEKKKISGELKLLRSQINPEFLFNSLNNIKRLVNSQPRDAISNIDDLSEIMSYMLYETSSEKVPLENEINYINNYISLQQARFNQGLIKFEVTGDPSKILIPPLLFMPILEKVFSEKIEPGKLSGINIKIDINKDNLNFNIDWDESERNDKSKTNNKFSLDKLKKYFDYNYGYKFKIETSPENEKEYLKINLQWS